MLLAAALLAIIDRDRKTIRFSGPGTFDAKDDIKRLGIASWKGDLRQWEVRNFTLSRAQLEQIFPGIDVQESGDFSEGDTATLGVNRAATSAHPVPERASEVASNLPSTVPEGVSVSELYAQIKSALRERFSGTIFVYGILGQVKHGSQGRVFLDLTQPDRPDERVSCVIWAHADKLCEKLVAAGFTLEPQLQVMFEANVSLNGKNGQISLTIVRIIHEYTLAKLAAQRELTNERLKKEGLFSKNKNLSLPFLPIRLGILTSGTGTVIHDFRNSLDAAMFGFELFWFKAAVQGAEAKESLLEGLRVLSALKLDAVLIFRGGGSQAELSVFNDYEVARAVCLCAHPVIAAIGHQEDQTSVQDVSFQALGVPKDIGRYFADIIIDYRRRVLDSGKDILSSGQTRAERLGDTVTTIALNVFAMMRQRFESSEERFQLVRDFLPRAAEKLNQEKSQRFRDVTQPLSALGYHVLEGSEGKLQALAERVGSSSQGVIDRKHLSALHIGGQLFDRASSLLKHETTRFQNLSRMSRELVRVFDQKASALDTFAKVFETADPAAQLRRGFSIVRAANGKVVSMGSALSAGDVIDIEFQDLKRQAEVKKDGPSH